MQAGLLEFTQAMDNKGPFFNGSKMSAVDIALFPFSYRIQLLGFLIIKILNCLKMKKLGNAIINGLKRCRERHLLKKQREILVHMTRG